MKVVPMHFPSEKRPSVHLHHINCDCLEDLAAGIALSPVKRQMRFFNEKGE
jgi:hypothetical protein